MKKNIFFAVIAVLSMSMYAYSCNNNKRAQEVIINQNTIIDHQKAQRANDSTALVLQSQRISKDSARIATLSAGIDRLNILADNYTMQVKTVISSLK